MSVNSTSFWYPDFIDTSAWLDHAPFAFWLTSVLRPRSFVELGTHAGYSYFAFCQAVKALGLETRCHAVDSWKGDEHAGFYGEEVFERVWDYNEAHYAAFSRLVRSSFDEALAHFADASVDLLHIDGRHFYEDVKHDFESWCPKLSEHAVVLFHDTNVRDRDFGVFRLWDELQGRYPTFEFLHGHGLGVLGYGSALPADINAFFEATSDPRLAAEARTAYARLGAAIKTDFAQRQTHARVTAKLEARDAEAKDLASKLQVQEARAAELEAKLEARAAETIGLASKLQLQEARAGKLEAKLEASEAHIRETEALHEAQAADIRSRDAEIVRLRDEGAASAAEVARLEGERAKASAAAAARRAQITEIQSSRSWRMTAPLRAVSTGLRWPFRHARRALEPMRRLGTEQFTRVATASLLYYQRFVPLRVKAMIPYRVREAVKRRLMGNYHNGIASNYELNDDDSLDERAANALREAAFGRLNFSVGHRLSHIEVYKDQVAEYVAERTTKTLKPKENNRIAIYTAISGGYDSIKLPEKLDPRFDYVLFTDTPVPDTGVYQVRPITYFHEDATRAARFVKTHPHLLLDGYDFAIWIDSNIMILGDIYPLVEEFLASSKAVAAVPHPMRKSVYEEVEACIRLKIDDPGTMRRQSKRYRTLGFDHDNLIETNLMMFNLRDEHISRLLDAWWAEIDHYSKRDQLSVNYALTQNGILWHRIMERPNSVRNHPMFALVRHDAGDGPANRLIDALRAPDVDPYAGRPYAEVRDRRIAAQQHRRIDIVACVHNALEDVKLCLESVRRARMSDRQKLIVIDDGSEQPTARYLEELANGASWIELHRNEQARGYTKAANQGLAASTGELVILLNSDTVVTDGWAEKMADAVYSTAGAGIVGPMSNAASHQSIPEHRSANGQTAVNELPPGLTAEDLNRHCEQWTVAGPLPRVPLVHGFCFGVTREVIERIGFFDEENFPRGYGEENDYCFRATDAGFGLVVAMHTYVFHAKSKSYADSERVAFMKAGSEALERLHGRPRIQRAVRSMQENPMFMDFRQRTRRLYAESPLLPESNDLMHGVRRQIDWGKRQCSVVGLLPIRADGHRDGTAYIRVLRPLRHHSLSRVLELSLDDKDWGEIGLDHDALLIQRDAVKSPRQAKELVERCRERRIRLIYEIDDDLFHLPDTHPAAGHYSPTVKEAMQTIARHADAVVVSTAPLKERMMPFNRNVYVVPNALDERLWHPADDPRRDTDRNGPVGILYMGTRTHDDDLAIIADPIRRLKEKYGERVTFTCIGAFARKPPEAARVEIVPTSADTYPDFAQWMARSCRYDIAVAPLVENDFNRHKSYIKYLDYAICGIAPVLSDIAPYRDVVRHRETGLLAKNDPDSWYESLCDLIEDPALRDKIGRAAQEDVLAHHTLAAQAEERRRIWNEILA